MTDSEVGVSEAPTAATAERTRRAIPQSTRRSLFVLAGVAVMPGSILGFHFASGAFDDRVEFAVAARDPGALVLLIDPGLAPDGTNVEDMTGHLDSEWNAAWQMAVDTSIGAR